MRMELWESESGHGHNDPFKEQQGASLEGE